MSVQIVPRPVLRLIEEGARIGQAISDLLDNLSPANCQIANDRITALGEDRERIERRLYDLDRIVMNVEETRATAHQTLPSPSEVPHST